jgi:hypothetical protein
MTYHEVKKALQNKFDLTILPRMVGRWKSLRRCGAGWGRVHKRTHGKCHSHQSVATTGEGWWWAHGDMTVIGGDMGI